MQQPDYDLNKIKFATNKPTFEKAVALYGSGKVTQFEEGIRSYSAVVQGTKPYRVSVEARRYDYGHCTCYLGQNETLCKHMVALALFVVMGDKPLTDEDKKLISGGVDDSDGIVGGFMYETVEVLKQYAEFDPACMLTFQQLQNRETCFGWEEPLLELIPFTFR